MSAEFKRIVLFFAPFFDGKRSFFVTQIPLISMLLYSWSSTYQMYDNFSEQGQVHADCQGVSIKLN